MHLHSYTTTYSNDYRKPRNARTARIVKAREPQLNEDRKKVLLLHGSKCPLPISTALKTISNLTKPDSIVLTKKNGDIHPFEDPASLEFLALKNDCGLVVFGTHSKKRPNNLTFLRIFDGKVLDMVEMLLLTTTEELEQAPKLQIGVEMKPMILFAGSQWDDASVTEQASLYRTMKSLLLDVFQGEEISAIDVAGLQYVMMIAAGEPTSNGKPDDPANKPVLHLRWYKVRTIRSSTPKVPRVELDPVGPAFDMRVGRSREADSEIMKVAMKHGRKPGEARTKKNIETDLVGDKLGRVHLGKQDLSQLQTRKMKGLKRGRDDDGDEIMNGVNGDADEDDMVSQDEDGGMEVYDDGLSDDDSDGMNTGDEIDIGDSDGDEEANAMPKRQRLA